MHLSPAKAQIWYGLVDIHVDVSRGFSKRANTWISLLKLWSIATHYRREARRLRARERERENGGERERAESEQRRIVYV